MQLLFNALIAGGLALVYGVLGVFNLALGQMVLVGGYATWWLHQSLGLPLAVSILGGLIIGAIVAWISFEIFIAPFYKRHRFLPIVTTIALSMLLDGGILLLFEERARGILPGLHPTMQLIGARISAVQIILILATCILLAVFAFTLHSTRFGRMIRAVSQNDLAAVSLGLPAPFLHRVLFILSGVLAACGGVFIGIDQTLSPTIAFSITIKAYAAIIAGGKGNFWGAILCAYLIALLEQLAVGIHWFGNFYIPAGYQGTVALVFIIGFLLLKPAGLFARSARLA